MDWKKLSQDINSKTYVLPKGWDSRETVAKQLDCAEEKVDDHLRPALKSGKVEKKQWPVWNTALEKKILVTAYRDASRDRKGGAPTPDTASAEFDLARAQALKKEGKTYAEIGAALGGINGEAVRSKLRKAG